MRLIVLSDLHANRPAMEAVLRAMEAWLPAEVVVAGDLVNRGPSPRPCLERILALRDRYGWQVLKGNHEDFVTWEAHASPARAEWEQKLYAHTRWTLGHVADLVPALQALPDHVVIAGPGGSDVRIVHASMRGNRVGLYEQMEGADLRDLIAPAPHVLVAGHTHVPFVRWVGDTLVVNAGSVGLPFDGDPRASFAVLTWTDGGWQAHIERVAYDRAESEADFVSSGYLAHGGPMVPLILDELRTARPRLGYWHRYYESRVAAGEMRLEESAERLLDDLRASPRPS